jgi:phosphoribosyl 1,2-cyclic phosphate phosphodiesterase
VRVLFLGTGTSHGVPLIGCDCSVCTSTDSRDSRLRASLYIRCDDGQCLLIDTSPDLRQQVLRHGIRRIDAILFTHAHADHIMGLDDVRQFNRMTGQPMAIFGEGSTLDDLRGTFAYIFRPGTPEGGGVPSLTLWEIGGSFCLGRQTVVPVPIYHGARRILGFRIGGLAYLTDCSAIPAESFALLENLDVLVLDALRRDPHPTHFTLDQAVAMAQRIGARRTFFTHIAHDLSHADVSAELPDAMELAYDGLEIGVENLTDVARAARVH